MRVVVFGPQGAGKGTQATRVGEKYHVPVISTGDMFRAAIRDETPLGLKAKEYVDRGQLVPDDVTVGVVAERLEQPDVDGGFLIDGFPRNRAQAETLDKALADKGLALDAALAIDVPEDVALERLCGRRTCRSCGRNYHVDAPPRTDWTCDVCGGEVVERADDVDEDAVRERLRIYREETAPLKDYYRAENLLREIDGVGTTDQVFRRVDEALSQTARPAR